MCAVLICDEEHQSKNRKFVLHEIRLPHTTRWQSQARNEMEMGSKLSHVKRKTHVSNQLALNLRSCSVHWH
jgi:SET domain-containing protein